MLCGSDCPDAHAYRCRLVIIPHEYRFLGATRRLAGYPYITQARDALDWSINKKVLSCLGKLSTFRAI